RNAEAAGASRRLFFARPEPGAAASCRTGATARHLQTCPRFRPAVGRHEAERMARIFLTHIPDMLANYYGPRAVDALKKLGEVRINPGADVLDASALAKAAQGCEIVVSDRQTAGPAEVFSAMPDLVAFLRCAVDIRNID